MGGVSENGSSKKASQSVDNDIGHVKHANAPVILVVIIIVASYSLFFAFQVRTELDVRAMVLQQSQQQQERIVLQLAQSIGGLSDKEDLGARMEVLVPSALHLMSDDSVENIALIDSTGLYLWTSDPTGAGPALASPADVTSTIGGAIGTRDAQAQPRSIEQPLTLVQRIEGSEYLTTIIMIPIKNSEGAESVNNDVTSMNGALYLVASTPLSVFLDEIDDILYGQRMQNFSLVAGVSLMTIIMTFFMNRNLRLKKEARNYAHELEESNKMIMDQRLALEHANNGLVKLDKMKDNFISIASHELKNPIQPILLCSELAKKGEMDKDKALDIILFNGRRLRQLASDILDVSKIDSGSFSCIMGKVRINEVMSELVKSTSLVGISTIKLEISIDQDVEIDGDKIRLYQVFSNLVSNASKFTTEGVIQIQTKTLASRNILEISISDTGSGIPEEILPNLFGKFVSFSDDQRNRHGSGLGLYIAKAIVNAHHGEIVAKNNSPSKGATFTVSIPITHGIKTDYLTDRAVHPQGQRQP